MGGTRASIALLQTMRAAACVLLTLTCATGRTASFDDARIAEDVTGTLHDDHIENVTVSVKNGRVTLVGIVDSEDQRELAGRDAERVPGVVAISNQISVRA